MLRERTKRKQRTPSFRRYVTAQHSPRRQPLSVNRCYHVVFRRFSPLRTTTPVRNVQSNPYYCLVMQREMQANQAGVGKGGGKGCANEDAFAEAVPRETKEPRQQNYKRGDVYGSRWRSETAAMPDTPDANHQAEMQRARNAVRRRARSVKQNENHA